MCGIAGIVTRDKGLQPGRTVGRMLKAISHRGPDQAGHKSYGPVTLGMARLSIISHRPDPIPYEDGTGNFAIVYNGEIYNHDSIRGSLESSARFRTDSDAETALYNFIAKGTASFSDYNGMYAFALYDKRRDTVYLVRDKTGEKPLYYCQGKGFIAFASEMKALLELVEPEFNPEALSYRAYEFTTGPETLFKGIQAVEPGQYLEVKGGRLIKHDYWKIWNQRIEVKDDARKIVRDLTELVEDSVLLRTRNCVHRFGCFISGGVDSSLMACISKPDFIYTAHYDYADFDELDYAKLVAKKLRRELVVVRPSKEDFERTRDRIARHLDTPCTWTSFSLWMLLERAKKDLRVVLSGEGADEVFAGYHRYHLLHHDEQIHRLEAMKGYKYLIERYYGSPVDRYVKLVNRCDNPYDETVNRYLREQVGYFFSKMGGDTIHAMGLNDFYTTMQVLLQMSDRMCMAFSVENRSPYLDPRLVQYGFSIPSKYKIRNGVTKWVLKEVAKKFIPLEIVRRTDKRGFSAPVNKWFEWDKKGKYDRSAYRTLALDDWKRAYRMDGAHV